jgi:hypothetical protein
MTNEGNTLEAISNIPEEHAQSGFTVTSTENGRKQGLKANSGCMPITNASQDPASHPVHWEHCLMPNDLAHSAIPRH